MKGIKKFMTRKSRK